MTDTNQKKYKALMLDMDGVVVKDSASMPTPGVLEALKKVREQGVVVTCVTGRPLHRAQAIIDLLKIDVPVVVEGGARIHDPVTHKDIYTAYIEPEALNAVVRMARERLLPANFSSIGMTFSTPEHRALITIYRAGMGKDVQPGFHALQASITEIKSSEDMPERITGIALYALAEGAGSLIHTLKQYPSLHVANNESKTFRGWRVITINDVRGTKQHGVLEFAKYMKLNPHEMIGVGDEETDYPLLMACGLKVAMGNAVQSLKDIADYVAPSVEEDGLVEVIEKFVLNFETRNA